LFSAYFRTPLACLGDRFLNRRKECCLLGQQGIALGLSGGDFLTSERSRRSLLV